MDACEAGAPLDVSLALLKTTALPGIQRRDVLDPLLLEFGGYLCDSCGGYHFEEISEHPGGPAGVQQCMTCRRGADGPLPCLRPTTAARRWLPSPLLPTVQARRSSTRWLQRSCTWLASITW